MKKAQTIFVKNNGADTFRSRYDGEDFEIAPGAAVEMLAECATLCLGFGEEDKTRVLRRLGWAFMQNAQGEALKRLNAFSFHMKEREALEFDATKNRSAAPAVKEPLADSSESVGESPPRVAGKAGPLEKLGRASANAAG